jgi:predicted HTH transcriptional regulator
MSRYIRQLISQGESQTLDFKYEISDASKIARSLVAFSNTDGGKLLIGVKDNGHITGIQSEEEYYMIEAAAHLYCKPEVPFSFRRWDIEGKTILEVDIPKAKKKPFLAKMPDGKWMAFIRVNDQNLLANRVLLKVWEKETNNKGTWIKYGDAEKKLLNYLRENPHITLSKFSRIAKISVRSAEDILVNLILPGILEIEITEKLVFYHLKKKIEENL